MAAVLAAARAVTTTETILRQIQAFAHPSLICTPNRIRSAFLTLEVPCGQGHGPGGDLRKLLKQKLPALLSWLLGANISVVTTRVTKAADMHACMHAALALLADGPNSSRDMLKRRLQIAPNASP